MDLRTEHAHQLANFFWRRVAVRPKFDIVADEVADERDVESAPVGLVVVEVNTAHLVREVIGSLLGIYPTPQKFYALVIAADAQISPPPGPDSFAIFTAVELSPDRVAMRRKGSDRNFHEYQLTPEGWRFVMPAVGVERWPNTLNNELLISLSCQP